MKVASAQETPRWYAVCVSCGEFDSPASKAQGERLAFAFANALGTW